MRQAPDDLVDRLADLADLVVPLALRAVCEMQIADLLAAGPRPVSSLAEASGADAGALRRVLRALVTHGVFAEPSPGVFALTPMAEFLRGDHALSLRDGYPLLAQDLAAWAHLDYSLRTGRAAFEHVHGRPYYDYLEGDSELRERFDRSVQAQNRLMLRPLLSAYDWSGCGTVIDVAGGNGTLLAGLLGRHSELRGVLFDLPHVVGRAPALLEAAGVADRCEIAAGSFFEAVPEGGDTYVLKTVLHDWDDERALAILEAVRRAMRAHSRLLVIEPLLPPGDAFHMGKLLDLNSLVLVAGPDRDERQLRALIGAGGLRVQRVIETTTLGIFEALREPDGDQVSVGLNGSSTRIAPSGA